MDSVWSFTWLPNVTGKKGHAAQALFERRTVDRFPTEKKKLTTRSARAPVS
jgi:hypothetical protein